MIAPDDVTYAYLESRPRAPKAAAWHDALGFWRTLASDAGAKFDNEVQLDGHAIEPMVTYGTHPGMAVAVSGSIPETSNDPVFSHALAYMGFKAGQPIANQPIDVVFIGSCTNGRLSDLRGAARLMAGHKIARGVRALVVPGSQQVKQAAEAEGLDRIFRDAGAEWRESGCSMCIGMNGDTVDKGQYALSTSNRNFEGRQGPGARTLLVSPLTAAASALRGRVTDPRELMGV
jgi:3-isopropylmalate/(R)-2-methylmalate dehydratase large subunit